MKSKITTQKDNKNRKKVIVKEYDTGSSGLVEFCNRGPVKALLFLALGVTVGIIYTSESEKYRQYRLLTNLKASNKVNRSTSCVPVREGSAVRMDRQRYVCPSSLGYRLGNMMFLYASNYGVAYDFNLTLAMDDRDAIYLPFRNIPRSPIDRSTRCRGFKMRFIQEKARYYQKFKVPRNGNIALFGYLQTWKYFSNSFEDLRRQFKWKLNIQNRALRTIRKLCYRIYPSSNPLSVTKVGIHIRRGDYVREKRPLADSEYVESAKKYFLERYQRVLFIVATNLDEEARLWSEENVINGTGVSVFSGFNDRYVDMAILSLCNHVIISTGTYGWWAGFLNKGTVVHFDWIPPHHVKYNRDDYILPNWIGIKPSHKINY
ncbi:galactoside alpha-(1,2)-fucosyltransferase 2-like [Argopecten irradians]|uniref:galactoside alpha-(1,2)-fucosyltransferase 2-like n=1 Tax=Argopecten irradians TaxID=31199 RepID=UPI003711CFAB